MTDHEQAGSPRKNGILGTQGTLVPLLFFCVFFLVSGGVGYWSVQTIADYQDDVTISLENIYRIDELYIDVLRAESGQRSYLLTDLDSYLTPYIEAEAVINTRLNALKEANLDKIQQSRLYELEILVNDKLIEMAETVDAAQTNRARDAIQAIFTHKGRDLMAEITRNVVLMEEYERNILSTRVIQTRNSRSTALLAIVLANIVGLIMVFVTWSLIRSNMRREQAYTEQLADTNASLEQRVAERTDELQRYSTELKRSNRELQDFAFVASHDLQEPLRKIRAFGDRLQKEYESQLGEKPADYVSRMQNASARMSKLIDDLLAFSRITTREKPFKPVDLNEVLNEVKEDLEVAIQESRAVISADPLPVLAGDYSQLKQLMQNLIGNAIKFTTPDTAPEIQVTSMDMEDDEVMIRIQDNGIGFDNQFAERIFMPFQRLHGKHEYSGTGIGLAICRRIVERHGGKINAHSEPGQGTCFSLTLPKNHNLFDQENTIEKTGPHASHHSDG